MQHRPSSPPYVMRIRRSWRIVIPVRGRLTPRIHPSPFCSEAEARDWLQSTEGQETVYVLQVAKAACGQRSSLEGGMG